MNSLVKCLVALCLAVAVGCNRTSEQAADSLDSSQKPTIVTHPVFQTNITGRSCACPAIHVDIKDDSEDYFFRAELYLTVQSSRFPNDSWVVLPLNGGDFVGARSRFVRLPFEVEEGDTLLFNLLDNDKLTSAQEALIVEGCRATGYCVLVAGELYCPGSATVANPVVSVASEILGEAVLSDVQAHYFENFGTAEYVVPQSLPESPQVANELCLRNASNYVPAVLKLYGCQATMERQGNHEVVMQDLQRLRIQLAELQHAMAAR